MPKKRKAAKIAAIVPDQEWFRQRMNDLALDYKDAEKKFGTYRTMIWRMISGERPPRVEEVIQWSELLQVPVLEVARRFGYNVPAPRVQVIGAVKANGRVALYPPGKVFNVEAPVDASGSMRAVTVEAPQSELQIYDGTFLYYEPSTTVDASAVGKLSVLEIGGISAPVVGVLHRVSAREKTVEVYGGRDKLETDQLISASPVLWQRMG